MAGERAGAVAIGGVGTGGGGVGRGAVAYATGSDGKAAIGGYLAGDDGTGAADGDVGCWLRDDDG